MERELIREKKCSDFIHALNSKAPAPGGGGAAALVAAGGVALAGMVGHLTTGKKKYAPYQADLERILKETIILQDRLLILIDEDAENFLPLAKAYGLANQTKEEKAHKTQALEAATKVANLAPLELIQVAYQGVLLHEELALKGSTLAISDVAVGLQCLRAALQSSWINVLINLRGSTDAAYVIDVNKRIKPMVDRGLVICDRVYGEIEKSLL